MTQTIQREAKLFEAGSYPDRGVDISEQDLDIIAANTIDAPVKIEHASTPFDGALGVLKSVYRKGKELFGQISFTKAAWDLIDEANAKRLSVAILKDKSKIAEVSLVNEPRIADAAVFSESDTISFSDSGSIIDASYEEVKLREKIASMNAQSEIDDLKRAGKITPASEIFAKAILSSRECDVITFGGGATSIAQVFRWFLDSQPKVVEFSELAKVDSTEADEPEVYTRLGITTNQVEKYRSR